jgi:hypothetical protein
LNFLHLIATVITLARMATPTKKTPLEFDQAKLQAMQEPITVRVQKKRGNSPMTIEVPGKGDGAAPGTNWSREEVLSLENWLLTEWSGGGYYVFAITDANGQTMKWESVYDPRTFPEKVPPNQASAAQMSPQALPAGVPASPQIQTPAAQPIPQQGAPLGMSTSNWPPPASTFGYGSQVVQPQVPQQGQSQAQGPWAQQPQMQPPYPGAVWNPSIGQWQPGYQLPGYGSPFASPLPGFGERGGSSSRSRFEREYERREREREERQRAQEREQERQRHQEEIRRRDEQLRERELAQREAEHKAALERAQQQHAAEMQKMRDEIRRLGERGRDQENEEVKRAREERQRIERERERDQINQQFQLMQQQMAKLAEKPTEDPRMRTLEAELQKQREDARILQEQQQRERERWEAQRAQENLAAQMKEQEARTREALKEATANRADPMVEYMKENARLSQEQSRMQAENMREIARMQQMSSDRMAQMMMTPQALAGIIRDSSSGADHLMKNVVDTFGGIFGTMRNAIEQVAQLTGGAPEPPAARIIEQGLHRAGEMAERYIGMKAAQAQSEAQVAAAKARSEAQVRAAAMNAQAQAAAAAAQQAQAKKAEGTEYTTASGHTGPVRNKNGQSAQAQAAAAARAAQQAGLGGAQTAPPPPPAPPKPGKPAQPKPPIDMDEGVTDPVTGQTQGAKVIPMKRAGHSDEEWFGIAMESVSRLRLGVQTFLENLERVQAGEGQEEGVLDEEGNVIGLDPSGAIDAILKGVNYVSANGIEILAFEDLFKQGRFAEFMDVILPDAPDPYKVDCVKILTDEVEVQVQPPAGVIDATEHQPELETPPE